MQKRAVFLCNCLHNGGAQRVLVSIANYMAEHGYEVYIIASFNNGSYPLNENIKVTDVGEGEYWKFLKVARKEIKQLQPKAVIAFEYFFNLLASIACFGLKTKLIVSERNDPSRVGAGIIKDRIRNYLYRFVDVLVCQTPDAKDYFPSYIQRKSIIIPNPLKPNLPVKVGGDRDDVVVSFCRLNSQKNLPMLFHAFKEFLKNHAGYDLKIYGDGEEYEKLKGLSEQLGIRDNVEFHPACDNVHELVLNAKMFVLPSDYEGLSNSMLEAMAIGLPTICTDCPCGGARMVIKNRENGILIPVRDAHALYEAMCSIADDGAFAEKLSMEAVKLRENLSIETVSQKWVSLF